MVTMVGWTNGRLDTHHAWVFEELCGGRVRILTQGTQNGQQGNWPPPSRIPWRMHTRFGWQAWWLRRGALQAKGPRWQHDT